MKNDRRFGSDTLGAVEVPIDTIEKEELSGLVKLNLHSPRHGDESAGELTVKYTLIENVEVREGRALTFFPCSAKHKTKN